MLLFVVYEANRLLPLKWSFASLFAVELQNTGTLLTDYHTNGFVWLEPCYLVNLSLRIQPPLIVSDRWGSSREDVNAPYGARER